MEETDGDQGDTGSRKKSIVGFTLTDVVNDFRWFRNQFSNNFIVMKFYNHYFLVMKWNESGFRPLLYTYRLNWARSTSCGRWDEWDDTALQTQDSKFEPWWSEADHLPLGHRGSPKYWVLRVDGEETFFVSFKPPGPGTGHRILAWKLTTTPGPPPWTA